MVLPMAVASRPGCVRRCARCASRVHNTVGDRRRGERPRSARCLRSRRGVAWGSPALRAVADEVVPGSGPAAVARLHPPPGRAAPAVGGPDGRRRLLLGYEHDGTEVSLAVRGRTILIAGEPGSGKSQLAGLLCEQLILQGYCVCIVDPEGDYESLSALPNVVTLGGDDPPPTLASSPGPSASRRQRRHRSVEAVPSREDRLCQDALAVPHRAADAGPGCPTRSCSTRRTISWRMSSTPS